MCSWIAFCEDQKKFNHLLIAPFIPVSVQHLLVDNVSMSNPYFLFSQGLISNLQAPAVKKEEVKEEEKKSEGPKFTAFTGKKYSLRDWGSHCFRVTDPVVWKCEIIDGVCSAFHSIQVRLSSYPNVCITWPTWHIWTRNLRLTVVSYISCSPLNSVLEEVLEFGWTEPFVYRCVWKEYICGGALFSLML